MDRIYADNNARMPLASRAVEAMRAAMEALHGNPSSQHQEGQQARAALELARNQVATCIGARSRDVVFTSGATESIHHALHGLLPTSNRRTIVTFATEHHATLDEVERMRQAGMCQARVLPVRPDGPADMDALRSAISDDTAIVSVMAANNETGALNDVPGITALAREHGAFSLVDAAQVVGKQPFNVLESGADAVALSACKFGGPPGVGALWLAPSLRGRFIPPRAGGAQELGRRPGTENLLGIIGMGAAASGLPTDAMARARSVRDRFEAGLKDAVIHGREAPRLPNTTFAAFPGVDVQLLLMLLDQAGIAASSGSACVSGAVKVSHVLLAMGVPRDLASSSVRFSFGPDVSMDDITRILAVLADCVPRATLRK